MELYILFLLKQRKNEPSRIDQAAKQKVKCLAAVKNTPLIKYFKHERINLIDMT